MTMTRAEGDLAKPALKKTGSKARTRILDAAYELFTTRGIGAVGVNAILARSGAAKASLYANFRSKTGLALAVLDRREVLWVRNWIMAEIDRRATDPREKLLAIFDAYDTWFRKKGFEGCTFLNALLEAKTGGPIHRAAAGHIATVREFLAGLAEEAALADTEKFARAWLMLMQGAIVSAHEGNQDAARDAKRGARLVLEGWPAAFAVTREAHRA